ncbi:FecR domain-containing protein [Phenylobacterium aquaticum]|uniref:FecR family protein n=1 Tax=Phenylobacterium aquaticum TaxID=1763816 RepID=UPI0026EC1528|nr:FecR domain-containing protein [Phenylobacterium aquaticum]
MSADADAPAAEALRDQALVWLVRVQSDAATAEDWAALTAWLEASDAHQAAFEAVELLSAEIGDRAGEIAGAMAPASARIIPFRPRRLAPFMAALTAAAAAVIVVPMAWRSYEGAPTVYSTGPGQTRVVALADGTHIRLDAASKMTVRLGWTARRVDLADAEATFDVAHDPSKPFLITVGDQQVRVVGTEFNIRHYDKAVVVSVRRGIVEVRQPALGPQPVARLTKGQELRHVEGAVQSTRAEVDPDAAFAWTQGRMVCDDRPLSEIVAYLNRRYPVPIRLGPAAARLKFSGVLEMGDQQALVRRLAGYLSLRVDRTGREITLG